MVKTYQEVLLRASSFLEEQGKEGYAIQYVFLARKQWTKTDWLLNMHQAISVEEEQQIEADMQQLLANHPPQYLLGFEEFYGRTFLVTPDTLIPRPETEELVEKCLQMTTEEKQVVVDVGTGTGAIGLTLQLERPNWQVSLVDISEGALSVAKENGQHLGANVQFYLGDTLGPIDGPVDIIVSNPPYISEEEWSLMDESVRLFEPKTALFAKENGLAIYRKLAQQAQGKLAADGKIFLEIGFQQGHAVQQIFQEVFPNKQVEIHQDLSRKDRMVIVY